ncbi:acoC [Symbiodinium microadriaticum]|nr:acoC [Symbiodinium microadriaticum]
MIFAILVLALVGYLNWTVASFRGDVADGKYTGPLEGPALSITLPDGQRINYSDVGPRDSSKLPVILIHGAPGHVGNWTDVPTRISAASGRRVITYDRVGYAYSSRRLQDEDHTIQQNADELLALMDALGLDQAIPVGWSFGGPIMTNAAKQQPDRFPALIYLAAAGPAFPQPDDITMLVGRSALGGWAFDLMLAGGPSSLDPMLVNFFGDPDWVPANAAENLHAYLVLDNAARTFRLEGGYVDYPGLDYSWVNQPTLVIHGDRDSLIPVAVGEDIADRLPNAELAVMKGIGHLPPITHPEETAALMIDFLAIVVLLIRDAWASLIARYGAVFLICVMAYLAVSSPLGATANIDWPVIVKSPITVLTFLANALFWLFGRALFEDGFKAGRLEWGIVAVFLVLTLMISDLVGINDGSPPFIALTVIVRIIQVGFLLHVLWIMVQGRKDDLIEARRQFRNWFAGLIAVYMILVAIVEITYAGELIPVFYNQINSLGIFLLTLFLNTRVSVLRRDDLIGPLMALPPEPAAMPSPTPVNGDLTKLKGLMDDDKVWLTEGLTIGDLADQVKLPEYRLRRLINGEMGYRNFTAFLNAWRLPAAAAALKDPDQARKPVLTIALELGFASIGPFNRAFKAEFGETPSAYRNKHK